MQNKMKDKIKLTIEKKQGNIRIAGNFKQLWTLIKMQLKAKANFFNVKSVKDILLNAAKQVFILLATFGISYSCFLVIRMFLSLEINVYMFTFLIGLFIISSVLSGTVSISKNLFESKDRLILLTYPTQGNVAYFSKIIVSYLIELYKNFSIIVGLCIGYGVINRFNALFYLNIPLVALLIPLFTISVSSILAIPYYYLIKFINLNNITRLTTFAIIVGLVGWLVIYIAGLVPDEFKIIGQWPDISRGISTFFIQFSIKTWIFQVFGNLISLRFYIVNLSIALGLSFGCCALTILVTRPLFYKLATQGGQDKTFKWMNNNRKSRKLPQFFSLFRKDLRTICKSLESISSSFMIACLAPFLTYLLVTIYNAIPVNTYGVAFKLTFTFGIILILIFAGTMMCANTVSSEEGNLLMLQSEPIDPLKLGFSKILPYMLVNTISVIICWVIVGVVFKYESSVVALLGTASVFLTLVHCFWSFDLDLLKPNMNKDIDAGEKKQTKNILISFLIGLLIAIVSAALVAVLSLNDIKVMSIIIFALSLVFLILRFCLSTIRMKVYFKRVMVRR